MEITYSKQVKEYRESLKNNRFDPYIWIWKVIPLYDNLYRNNKHTDTDPQSSYPNITLKEVNND